LAKIATDLELRSLLAGIAKERARGRVFYGAEVPRPRVQQLSTSKGVAVINDCQDASHAGVEDLKTGQKYTVGVARNHVVATMHRGTDGIWRVAFVSYPKSKCA
jgi:hypothetical protein